MISTITPSSKSRTTVPPNTIATEESIQDNTLVTPETPEDDDDEVNSEDDDLMVSHKEFTIRCKEYYNVFSFTKDYNYPVET